MASEVAFEDHLPTMARLLGSRGFMQELEKGFRLFADPSSHTITEQSLRQSFILLKMPFSDSELRDIIRLGDSSGRGELNLHQFCVTMIRLSPTLDDQDLATVFLDCFSEQEDDEEMEDAMEETQAT